jgi:hypothetical protein
MEREIPFSEKASIVLLCLVAVAGMGLGAVRHMNEWVKYRSANP